jgi:hypothetical protein
MIVYATTMVFCLVGNPDNCQTVPAGISFPQERCEMHGQMWAKQWLAAHPGYQLKSTSCDPKEQE